MPATLFWKRLANPLLLSCLWFLGVGTTPAQETKPAAKPTASPPRARTPREFLHSPREAVKTLYFAAVAYDLRPQLMDEAVACLDLDPDRATDPGEAVRLAIDLEQTLRILCVPLHSIPEKTEHESVVVLDADPFKVILARGDDGLWRFDRGTVERIPTMNRASLARFRSTQADRAALLDEYTDPGATLRRFLMDLFAHDFYAAARSLDLSFLPAEERGDKGPLLAQQLAFVIQRRGWLFLQEVPNFPDGPPFTWHADRVGRIVLERIHQADGKDAWLFSKKTVRNIAVMYKQATEKPADPRYVLLGMALPPLTAADAPGGGTQRPASIPPNLDSPRASLKGFFRAMDAAETNDARLAESLEYLDLQAIPPADRRVQGTKVAVKLEAVLRKINIDLSALPDDWNAPAQILGAGDGVRIEIARQRDGCWRFSQGTVSQAPAFFDKLAAKDRADRDRSAHLDSARDTMSTFLTCTRRSEYDQAAECLDLSHFRPGTQAELGPLLAYKLRYVLDRIGRVYIQEVPDAPDGPRYLFYRGDLGRIVIARRTEGEHKGSWQFTPDTVALIERMFRNVLDQPARRTGADGTVQRAGFWAAPGIWIHHRVPPALTVMFWRLHLYQWLGLVLAVVLSSLAAWLVLAQVHRLFALMLHKSGSILTRAFVAAKLRSLTWVIGWWLLFRLLTLLDLPVHFLDAILPIKIFGMAGLMTWFGMQLVDLVTGVCMNSELLRPHRSLSDMIVPVSMRALKGILLLMVAVYVVYQVGEGESLARFLTGLGVAGLAASLAAQDTLKSFFSTLLLIGERSFKIGDRITVGDQEGVVEQVGFRATRLRTTEGALLIVPNSTITSAPVGNHSTRAASHCKASLLVNCDATPERIVTLRDRMKAWLMGHPGVRNDKVDVSVSRVAERGVEVTLDLYLEDATDEAEKGLREEINREVLRLCDSVVAGEVGTEQAGSVAKVREEVPARHNAA